MPPGHDATADEDEDRGGDAGEDPDECVIVVAVGRSPVRGGGGVPGRLATA